MGDGWVLVVCGRVVLSLMWLFLSGFCQRSSKKLGHLGDTAADAQRYDEAISHYTTALSLNPPSPQGILIKRKLEHLGDTAVDAQRYDDAISHYTTALSYNPPSPQGILIKRGKVFMATGSWKQAVDDANQVRHFYLVGVNLVNPPSSGDHARSVVAMGL